MSELKHRALAKCDAVFESAPIFYRAKWSQVKEGDVVLVRGDEHPIAEVTVKEIHEITQDDGSKVITVYYRMRYATYGVPCDPLGVVYIQSRF